MTESVPRWVAATRPEAALGRQVACREFLSLVERSSPRTKVAVQSYNKYLTDIRTPTPYNFIFEKISWGDLWGRFTFKYQITVEANQSTVGTLNSFDLNLKTKGVQTVDVTGSLPSLTPKDPVTLSIKFYEDGKTSTFTIAQGEFLLSDLRESKVLETGSCAAKLWVHVEGLPVEPTLPEYSVIAGK
jgi:hypothetical protein